MVSRFLPWCINLSILSALYSLKAEAEVTEQLHILNNDKKRFFFFFLAIWCARPLKLHSRWTLTCFFLNLLDLECLYCKRHPSTPWFSHWHLTRWWWRVRVTHALESSNPSPAKHTKRFIPPCRICVITTGTNVDFLMRRRASLSIIMIIIRLPRLLSYLK